MIGISCVYQAKSRRSEEREGGRGPGLECSKLQYWLRSNCSPRARALNISCSSVCAHETLSHTHSLVVSLLMYGIVHGQTVARGSPAPQQPRQQRSNSTPASPRNARPSLSPHPSTRTPRSLPATFPCSLPAIESVREQGTSPQGFRTSMPLTPPI